MKKYKSYRIINDKPRWVIVDENEKIVNRNPNKDELKGIKRFPDKDGRSNSRNKNYTDEELLNYLKQFFEENGRIPITIDFVDNFYYPCFTTYQKRFGSWANALKLVKLDVDSMVKNEIINTTNQKARLAEIKVLSHFRQHPIDLAGENCISHCDGICPNGKTYDVKSSGLRYDRECYTFVTRNKYKEEIEIYYLLGFNKDYTKLNYGWRIPGEIAEKDYFVVGLNSNYEFNIENMKGYDITNKFSFMYE